MTSDRDFIKQMRAACDAQLGMTGPDPTPETCEEMITRLYHEVLHREPDPAGFSYWVGECRMGKTEVEITAMMLALEPAPTPPPGGNPGAIQPPIPWNKVTVVGQPSNAILAYPIPVNPNGKASVEITQGQMGQGNTPSRCKTEYFVSRTPGIIDPAGGAYYYASSNISYQAFDIYSNEAGPFPTPLCDPALGPWYLNIRWSYPDPMIGKFSMQWVDGPY